jgi:hypothetical protein
MVTLLGLVSLWIALLLAGCAVTHNTLAQDLAWERIEKCKGIANELSFDRVEPDGRIWYQYRGGGRALVDECLRKAAVEQAQRRVSPAVPSAVASGVAPTMGRAAATAGILMPTWKIGDEWAYRQESTAGAMTFVRVVDSIDKIDGVEHYVVISGTRRIYYRTADGAETLEKLGSQITDRFIPGWVLAAWPLTFGKTWETHFTQERPRDRMTWEVAWTCDVGAEESLSVPAGTFTTVPITCRNRRSGVLVYQQWYAPAVKNYVKEVWQQSDGPRLREMIAYRLR